MASSTFWAAFVRAGGAALLAFFGSAYSAYLYLDGVAAVTEAVALKGAALAGFGAVLTTLGWRAGVEGGYDAWRQSKGIQTTADVTSEPPPAD